MQIKTAATLVILAGVFTFASFGWIAAAPGAQVKPDKHPNAYQLDTAVIWLELALSGKEVHAVLGTSEEVRAGLAESTRRDALFLLAYPTMHLMAHGLLATLLARRPTGYPGGTRGLASAFWLSFVMAGCDWMENRQMKWLMQLPAAALPQLKLNTAGVLPLFIASRIKWAALYISAIQLAMAYSRHLLPKRHSWLDIPRHMGNWRTMIATLYAVPAVAGLAGLLAPRARLLVEKTSPLLGVAWLLSIIHAVQLRSSNGERDSWQVEAAAQEKRE